MDSNTMRCNKKNHYQYDPASNIKLKFLLLLLVITIIFIAANTVSAQTNQQVPKPTLSSRTVFVNDIFDPLWWWSIPTNLVSDIFNPLWWVNVQAHFFNDIFNNSWWWLGYHPSQLLFQPIADHDAAQGVIAEINALPTKNVLDLTDASAVSAASTHYAALTPAQKALVTNYSTLTTDKARINSLQDAVHDAVAEPAANQNPAPAQKKTNPTQIPMQSTNPAPTPNPPPLSPAPPSKPDCGMDYCKFVQGWLDSGLHHFWAKWVCNCNACQITSAGASTQVCGPAPTFYTAY